MPNRGPGKIRWYRSRIAVLVEKMHGLYKTSVAKAPCHAFSAGRTILEEIDAFANGITFPGGMRIACLPIPHVVTRKP